MRVRFGPFAFDRQSRLLSRDETDVALPPRVLGVLELLIDRAGQVVARQDLLDGVWKDAFVTDTSLAEAVSFLRQALGDDPQSPRYIQTVHRRGYRFVAPVVAEGPVAAAVAAAPVVPPAVPPERGQARVTPLSPDTERGQARVRPLSDAAESTGVDEEAVSRVWQYLPLAAAALTAIALLAAAVWGGDRVADADLPPVVRFEVHAVPGTAFDRRGPALAVSPDGRAVAWSGCDEASGACAVYVRRVDRLAPATLAGTDRALSPFFSPDGRWIGFFADSKLKKIAADGGPVTVLADVAAPAGGAWGVDGRIAFAGSPGGGISVVDNEGGGVSTLTSPRADRGEVRHLYPSWLPSGGMMFTAAKTPLPHGPGDLVALSATGRDWQTLRSGVIRGALAAPAYLLLASGTDLQAVTFDERSLTLTSGSDSVIGTIGGAPVSDFATAGGALFATPATTEAMTWNDGAKADALSRLTGIVISPDSTRAAGVIAEGAGADVWIADIASGALTRITYGGVNVSPAWSADGSRVFFATRARGPFTIASRTVDDRTVSALATSHGAHLFPSSVAHDGRIAATTTAAGHTAIALVQPSGAVDVLQAGPFDEGSPAFSPDAHWLAFESAESGRTDIVARELATGRRVAVSADGGLHPRWTVDGHALFYDTDRGLMRASFDPDRGVVSAREVLTAARSGRIAAATPTGRLLLVSGSASTDTAYFILQWLRDLRQRLPLPTPTPR